MTVSSPRAEQARWRRSLRRNGAFYAMLLLPICYYILFCYVPMGGLVIAFQKYNAYRGIASSKWVGLQHFRDFLNDPYFRRIFANTIVLGVYQILFAFPMPVLMALLLNELRSNRFKRIIQTISYMPHFISTVVVVGMLTNFLSHDGIINTFMTLFGISRTTWLIKPSAFRTIYTVSGIWQELGWGSIVYLAALTGIDPGQYEAATIDGAGRFQRIRYITLPGILPTITIMFIFKVGAIMSASFEKVLLLYNPSVYETADIISTYVYRRGLVQSDFSYGTAVGLFNSIVALFFLTITNWLSRKMGETSLW